MTHDEFKADDAAILELVRAVCPPDASAATYLVLVNAARGAVDAASVRSDGQVHHEDALAILRKAMGGTGERSMDQIRAAVHEACQRFGYALRGDDIDAIVERVTADLRAP